MVTKNKSFAKHPSGGEENRTKHSAYDSLLVRQWMWCAVCRDDLLFAMDSIFIWLHMKGGGY